MNNRKGFIQIPILIAIIVGVLFLVGAKQYKDYRVEQEKASQEKEKEAQAVTEVQQKALDETKSEIEALKKQTADSDKRQKTLEQQIQTKKPSIEITAKELTQYLYGIVQIDCDRTLGSGTLWKIGSGYFVLTNQHVVGESTYPAGYCLVPAFNAFGSLELHYVYPSESQQWNSDTDVALLPVHDSSNNSDKTKLVYSISALQKCAPTMHTGSLVVVIGYPAYAQQGPATQITTNGIISGFGPRAISLPNPNYFVSAKIDSGNSGGVALSKDENGLCVLGIPTWLTVGNYETQGVVQNIHNVMYQK